MVEGVKASVDETVVVAVLKQDQSIAEAKTFKRVYVSGAALQKLEGKLELTKEAFKGEDDALPPLVENGSFQIRYSSLVEWTALLVKVLLA